MKVNLDTKYSINSDSQTSLKPEQTNSLTRLFNKCINWLLGLMPSTEKKYLKAEVINRDLELDRALDVSMENDHKLDVELKKTIKISLSELDKFCEGTTVQKSHQNLIQERKNTKVVVKYREIYACKKQKPDDGTEKLSSIYNRIEELKNAKDISIKDYNTKLNSDPKRQPPKTQQEAFKKWIDELQPPKEADVVQKRVPIILIPDHSNPGLDERARSKDIRTRYVTFMIAHKDNQYLDYGYGMSKILSLNSCDFLS